MSVPSGQVYLCKNAIVDRNYGHTIDFKSPSEQLAYWGSLVKFSVNKEVYSYIRRDTQEIAVPYKLDEIQDVNYLYYRASENSKWYFCFVDDKKYVSETVSKISFHTDVLQTYMFDYKVNQSYVLQEHTDRWDADHKPIYSRTEEGLDYGSEYTVESAYKVRANNIDANSIIWYLAVCKTGSMTGNEPTTLLNIPNPYVYFLLPINDSVDMFYLNNNETTIRGIQAFTELMGKESSLGDFVQQIVRLPYPPFDFSVNSGPFTTLIFNDITVSSFPINNYNFIKVNTFIKGHFFEGYKRLAEMNIFEGIDSAMPTAEQWEKVTSNPYTTERDKRFESKLLTYPYRYNLLSDWRGQPQVIKNEYIGADKIRLNHTQALSFNSPSRYWIEGYKKDPEGRGSSLVQLIHEEAPVVTDAYYSYILSNKNQIQANQTNAIVSSVTSVGQSLVGGAIFGGPAGAISGAIGGAVSGAVNYQNMIRSENAKQKDLKNLPDTIINNNDGAFSILDNNLYITFYRMKICCEFEELLADTFAMTGYTVKRVKVPNLRTRARYNYVKTVGANIVGSFDQNDLSLIKQIFDNGITFWHYNTVNFKPFDYSLENIETKLIKG